MKIPSANVIKDYRALRQAASEHKSSITSEMTGRRLGVKSAQIDEDPATTDTIVVVASGNGAFSGPGSAPARLTFTEHLQNGKPVLELTAQEADSSVGGEMQEAKASIDLQSGFLIASSGEGTYFISGEPVVAPTPPVAPPQDAEAASIRAGYSELKGLLSEHTVGDEFFLESLQKEVKLEKADPGLVEISYWGGAFSGPGSGTLTESFREFTQEGRSMLEHHKVDPGDFMGMGGSETRTTIAL
jgi:hypothetical protein